MRTLSFLLLIGLLISSCKPEKNSIKTKSALEKAPTKVVTSSGKTYPPLPQELGMKIWNEGEMIDYLFHNLPFSMSQDEQASIQTNMTYIAAEPVADIPSVCKPIARQFYQVGGDIILESDVYFSDGCMFYVFLVDGKEKYCNQMNAAGQQFFANIIQQAMSARQGMTQPQ